MPAAAAAPVCSFVFLTWRLCTSALEVVDTRHPVVPTPLHFHLMTHVRSFGRLLLGCAPWLLRGTMGAKQLAQCSCDLRLGEERLHGFFCCASCGVRTRRWLQMALCWDSSGDSLPVFSCLFKVRVMPYRRCTSMRLTTGSMC